MEVLLVSLLNGLVYGMLLFMLAIAIFQIVYFKKRRWL